MRMLEIGNQKGSQWYFPEHGVLFYGEYFYTYQYLSEVIIILFLAQHQDFVACKDIFRLLFI